MKEIYKNITDTNFKISNKGRLLYLGEKIKFNSGFTKIIEPYYIKLKPNNQGYYTHSIKNFNNNSILGNHRLSYIHRLVAIYFIENPLNLPVVNHLDGNKLNNDVTNLKWDTLSENTKHAWRTGLNVKKKFKIPFEKIQDLILSGISYDDIEKNFNLKKGYIQNRRNKEKNRKFNSDSNSRLIKNANQSFVDSINNLTKKGLNAREIEVSLNLKKYYLSEIRKLKKFKDFSFLPFNNHIKISHEKGIEIIKDRYSGMTLYDIAKKYNIHFSMVSRIKERKDFIKKTP